MLLREEQVDQHPEAGRMISIPLPPRDPNLAPTTIVKWTVEEVEIGSRESLIQTSDWERQRRRTLVKAVAISGAICTAVFAILFFIVLGGDDSASESPLVLMAALPELSPEKDEIGGSAGATSESKPVTVQPVDPVPLARVVPDVSIVSMELSTFAVTTESTQPQFEMSMSDAALKGKRGGFGQGAGTSGMGEGLTGFFKGKNQGDGSEMVLIIDVSGSMQKRSEQVARYVEINFPKATIVEVLGCAFRAKGPGFSDAFRTNPEIKAKLLFVFVCDLQDPVTSEGIDPLQRFLLESDPPKKLDIISFEKTPKPLLRKLLRVCGGEVVYPK